MRPLPQLLDEVQTAGVGRSHEISFVEGDGTRVARSGAVRCGGKTFPEFMRLDIGEAHEFARGLLATYRENPALGDVVVGIEQRLHFLLETGLGYLTLERDYATLSGGESQRVRPATQLGMGLMGGALRLPMTPLAAANEAVVEQALRAAGLLAVRERLVERLHRAIA